MKYLLPLFLMISLTANANCDKPVTSLKEGDKAPCQGYLFTEQKELEVRYKIETYDTMSNLVKKQDEMINILTQRIDNNQKQIDVYDQKLQNQASSEFYQKLIYFGLGVLTTTIIANTVIHNVR